VKKKAGRKHRARLSQPVRPLPVEEEKTTRPAQIRSDHRPVACSSLFHASIIAPAYCHMKAFGHPSSMKCRWQQIKARQPQQILPYNTSYGRGSQVMSVHPSILPRCLGKIVGRFQLFDVVLWKDAPHRLHGWTLICCYPLSYTVGNVSLGLAHGMDGILHVVTVARDIERHRRFA
jgi:hypothetical protein